MTSQRNKKQEHKNEKLYDGSHWIMDPTTGDCGSRGAPCRSHDITSCNINFMEISTLEISNLEIARLEMSFWK